MAKEKEEKKEKDKPPAAGGEAAAVAASGAKSDRRKLMIVVGGVMLLEGAAIFGAMKLMGGGAAESKAEPLEVASKPTEQRFEVEVAKIRAPNVKDGKLVLWSLEVAIRVTAPMEGGAHGGGEGGAHGGGEHGAEAAPASPSDAVVKLIKEKERTIKDRLASIVRSAEPQQLQEDGLATIRRQVKFELERTLGPDVHIVEVLIPECTPFPTGY